MLLFSALVGGSFALGTRAAPLVDPAALNAARFWIATAILGAAVALRGGVPRAALTAPWRYVLLGGVFGSYFVLMFVGLQTAASVSASAVFTLTPVMAAGFGWLLLRQRLTGRMAAALAIGAAGALWVIFGADLAAFLRFDVGRGEAIYFFGCLAHALYTPLVRVLNRGETALVFSFGTLVAGSVLLTLWGGRAIVATDWTGLPQIVWIALLYLAVFASAATFLLLQYATMRLPSAKVMAYTYLVPVWVTAWEIALGGPVPRPLVALGVAFTALALVLLLRDEEPRQPREPPRRISR